MKLRYQYIISVLFIASLFGQFRWYNHPELEWRTLETEHFKIHYHQATERSAREAAEVAEYVYKPITDLYDFRPKNKTEIVINGNILHIAPIVPSTASIGENVAIVVNTAKKTGVAT